jgi:hypothetical protein
MLVSRPAFVKRVQNVPERPRGFGGDVFFTPHLLFKDHLERRHCVFVREIHEKNPQAVAFSKIIEVIAKLIETTNLM